MLSKKTEPNSPAVVLELELLRMMADDDEEDDEAASSLRFEYLALFDELSATF